MAVAHATSLLARLRACQASGRPVSPELLSQVIDGLAGEVTARTRLRERNTLIRRAALLLPDGSASGKASALLVESRRLGVRSMAATGLDCPATVRECLAVAANHGRLPSSQRHFLRVLLAAPDT